ncbi:MAG: hypothetical protein CVU48_06600 [Candidatus Cloacimonetes bacterium HGW-Cloacimonetes-1]|jgi:hypothetical protein|nr:MAG: hypothetical protein CVU48_06600 [Candidatus Cloacimonetes bacterium HGW-Cloacimonetes-1]
MVRNFWLVIVITVVCTCLWAQTDSLFVTPRLLLPTRIELPKAWPHSYENLNVLVEVRIYADSSVAFVSLKDPRTELIPLVEQAVLNMRYTPLFEKGKAVESILLVTIPISTELVEAPKAVQIPVSREYIDSWIDQEMQCFNVFQPIIGFGNSKDVFCPPEIYRQGYHFIGRNSDEYRLLNNGYELGSTVFGQSLYLGYWQGFNRASQSGDVIRFTTEVYEQPVTLTDIQASLGDYEFKYARVSMKKNYLFGVPDLYYGLDFLVQNGYWTDVIADQTSVKHFLRYAKHGFDLRFTFEDYAQNIGMIQLNPIYWQTSIYRIDHLYRQITLDVLNPYLSIGITDISESAKSPKFTGKIRSDNTQIKLFKNIEFGALKADLAYTKAFVDNNIDLTRNYYDNGFEDLIRAQVGYESALFAQDIILESYDFERHVLEASSALKTRWGKYGILGIFKSGLAASFDETASIYNAADTLRSVNIDTDYSVAGFYQKQIIDAVQLGVRGGIKHWINQYPVASNDSYSNLEQSADVPFVDLNVDLKHAWGDYEVECRQSLGWQEYQGVLCELPQLRHSTYLNVRRNLPYNNAIFAGANLSGHSAYKSQNAAISELQESAILDLWAGVQITRMFEFALSMKNVTDTSIYGIYPLPQSFHATVRWFYLN